MSVETLQTRFTPDRWGDYLPEGYDGIIDLYGETVARLELGSYQGDLLYVVRDPSTGLFAYVHTGYGSCTGCDQIQHIGMRLGWDVHESEKAWQDLADLVEEMRPTQWMGSTDLLAWLRTHDWRGDYLGGDEAQLMKWVKEDVAPKLTG